MAPSAVTPQASLSQPVATLQSGPGASYDASGSWHFTISLKPNGPPIDEGDDTFTQDANGNLLSADHTVHFTRVGTGSTISYQVSIFEVHRQCNTSLSGQGQLDTKTNTIKAHVLGTEQDCSKAEYFIAATKN